MVLIRSRKRIRDTQHPLEQVAATSTGQQTTQDHQENVRGNNDEQEEAVTTGRTEEASTSTVDSSFCSSASSMSTLPLHVATLLRARFWQACHEVVLPRLPKMWDMVCFPFSPKATAVLASPVGFRARGRPTPFPLSPIVHNGPLTSSQRAWWTRTEKDFLRRRKSHVPIWFDTALASTATCSEPYEWISGICICGVLAKDDQGRNKIYAGRMLVGTFPASEAALVRMRFNNGPWPSHKYVILDINSSSSSSSSSSPYTTSRSSSRTSNDNDREEFNDGEGNIDNESDSDDSVEGDTDAGEEEEDDEGEIQVWRQVAIKITDIEDRCAPGMMCTLGTFGTSLDAVALAPQWTECVGWDRISTTSFYGAVNAVETQTRRWVTVSVMRRFRTTLLATIDYAIDVPDGKYDPQVMDALAQVFCYTLPAAKARGLIAHNDAKVDNVLYSKCTNAYLYVIIDLTSSSTDDNEDHREKLVDRHSQTKKARYLRQQQRQSARLPLVLRIPTHNRKFVLSDFEWATLCVSLPVTNDKEEASGTTKKTSGTKDGKGKRPYSAVDDDGSNGSSSSLSLCPSRVLVIKSTAADQSLRWDMRTTNPAADMAQLAYSAYDIMVGGVQPEEAEQEQHQNLDKDEEEEEKERQDKCDDEIDFDAEDTVIQVLQAIEDSHGQVNDDQDREKSVDRQLELAEQEEEEGEDGTQVQDRFARILADPLWHRMKHMLSLLFAPLPPHDIHGSHRHYLTRFYCLVSRYATAAKFPQFLRCIMQPYTIRERDIPQGATVVRYSIDDFTSDSVGGSPSDSSSNEDARSYDSFADPEPISPKEQEPATNHRRRTFR